VGKLNGQVAIVTGSSRGIGHFIARELAKQGCSIVVAARSEEVTDERLPGTIHSVAEELRGSGVDAMPFRLDVTDEEQVSACVAATIERFGRIDLLVNNAGVMAPAPVAELPLKRLDLIYRINVRGPFAMSQAVLPQMLKQGRGTIITVSSGAADSSGSGNVSYSMSKVAIEKLMAGLAAELGDQGIRSFALKPEGIVLSPGATYFGFPERAVDVEEEPAMGRAAIWLATSEEAGEHNGEAFYSRALLRDHTDT
jgi:NAD(P)-dependent dehydrogenase (short-subunit alcohol dehydrogenase family)